MAAGARFTRHFVEGIVKALIIYDNYSLAADAQRNLEHAAELTGETTTRENVAVCPVDRFKQASRALEMLHHAADAHLIVIALGRTVALPAHLLDWLAAWAAHRQVEEAAIAIFGGENHTLLSPAAIDELSRFAKGNGLGLVRGQASPLSKEIEPDPRHRDKHDATLVPELHGVNSAAAEESYLHWGLNE